METIVLGDPSLPVLKGGFATYGYNRDGQNVWEMDGLKLVIHLPQSPATGNVKWKLNTNHRKKDGAVSLISDIADWYVLGYLKAQAPIDVNAELLSEFQGYINSHFGLLPPEVAASIRHAQLTEAYANVFHRYFFYACARESRYHKETAKVVGKQRNRATSAWKLIYDHFGAERTAGWLKKLFNSHDNHWHSAYGGASWASIAAEIFNHAKGEYKGLPYTNETFIDRAVTLQHNGGIALNKIHWGASLYKFQDMCNTQHSSLEKLVMVYCSPQVRKLYENA